MDKNEYQVDDYRASGGGYRSRGCIEKGAAYLIVFAMLCFAACKAVGQVFMIGSATLTATAGRATLDFTLDVPAGIPVEIGSPAVPILPITGARMGAPMTFPKDPSGLGTEWEEVTPPERQHLGNYREFRNKKSGERIRFDRDPKYGDHWHRYNTDPISSYRYPYLSRYGELCPKKGPESHIYPSIIANQKPCTR